MAKQPTADVSKGEQQQDQDNQEPTLPTLGAGLGEQALKLTTETGALAPQLQQDKAESVVDKKRVTLLGPYKNYSKGDVTHFAIDVADHLIKSKLAEPFLDQEQGQE
jgi:hypothetical protein